MFKTYGGAAKGMPRNSATFPMVCPWKDPYERVTMGLELELLAMQSDGQTCVMQKEANPINLRRMLGV
jgi:hypothetical protein